MSKPRPTRYRRKSSVSRAHPRPEPSTKKTLRYVIFGTAVLLTLLFFLSPTSPVVQDLRVFHHTPSHKPPSQKNSTVGEVRWYSDWKWLKPFSASITLDEDRSVLPPLKARPPIYTFYDADEKKEDKIKAAENRLLLQWRRAWWAQGFRPVVLGKSEAVNHPQYQSAMSQNLQPQMKTDLIRWLAWGQMGTGILANWLVHPMGAPNEHLFAALRKGVYPSLARYEGLGGGLFSGEQNAINAALTEALKSLKLQESRSVIDAVSRQTLTVEPNPPELAFYDSNTNAEYYKPISASIAENKAEGLEALASLINSHLHQTFTNNFPDGFAVLTPFPSSAGILSQRARSLAEALRTCPPSPIPSSCPPNRQGCRPCSSASPLAITTPDQFSNRSSIYTIGTVPHPLTLASLKRKTKDITTRYIRRDTDRDPWLNLVTAELLGKDLGGQGRIVSFKDLVAGDHSGGGGARGLWMTDVQDLAHKGMEHHFGFSLPAFNLSSTTSPIDSSSSTSSSDSGSSKSHKDSLRTLKHQHDLLTSAVAKIVSPNKSASSSKAGSEHGRVREMVEAWNLADTEAWRFVRALAARESVERTKWEREERRFAGGDPDGGVANGEGKWRWFDRS